LRAGLGGLGVFSCDPLLRWGGAGFTHDRGEVEKRRATACLVDGQKE